ncbi:MAG: hypothetical protein J6U21_02135 [Bacteroidales bacterium]|nr:hypothetical protein [Bacteroidales bacterium]
MERKFILTICLILGLSISISSCGDDEPQEYDGFEIYCIYENATSVNLKLIKKGVDTLTVKVNSAVTDTKYDDMGGCHSFVKSQSRTIIYGDSIISIDDHYRFNFNDREKTSDHSANEYYIFTDSLLTNIKDSMAVKGIFPKLAE